MERHSVKVAILGTGRMGSAIARRLSSRGVSLVLWNRTRSRAESLARDIGADVADSVTRAVESVEIAIASLADDEALYYVVSQIGRVDGLIFVNTGTHTPAAAQRAREFLEQRGACYVESPIVGGPRTVESGRAVLILAGRRPCLALAEPILSWLAQKLVRVGDDPGRAQALKLAFNSLLITTVNALAESLALAEAYGIDPGVVKEFLGETVFSAIASKYIDRMRRSPEEPASFTLRLASKDLHYALEAAWRRGLPLHGVAGARERFLDAVLQGLGDADYTRVYWSLARGKGGAKQG